MSFYCVNQLIGHLFSLLPNVQAIGGEIMVGGISSSDTLKKLVPTKDHLNITDYCGSLRLSINDNTIDRLVATFS